jgi:endoglucanase
VAATTQLPMPDADHAAAFWASVATAFKSDPGVVFDLFNEPFVTTANAITSDPWSCWLHGCTIRPGYGVSAAWKAAGMQSLVDAVRSAGATQPLLLGGLAWASDLSQWLSHRPRDPVHQLAASFHLYNFAGCSSMSCWDSQVAPVAAKVPVVTGELGENDCAGSFVDSYMHWADSHAVSYLGWTWNTWSCSGGPALISTYSGTPTAFGTALQTHLSALTPPTFSP